MNNQDVADRMAIRDQILIDFNSIGEVTTINEYNRSGRDMSDPSYSVLQGVQ